jgi:branched-chain amino acid transport system permease protein
VHLLPGLVAYGLTTGAYYSLLAIGFTLIYATTRSMNFAHGQIYSLSSYAVLGLLTFIVASELARLPTPLLVVISIVAAIGIGAILGVLIERVAFRSLRGRPNGRLASILVTFGIAIVVDNLLFLHFPHGAQTLPLDFKFPSWRVSGQEVSVSTILLVGGALVIALGMDEFLHRTREGKAIRATAIDGEATSVMGVNVSRVLITTFAISGGLAGYAAAAATLNYGVLDPLMGSVATLKALVAAVAGGFGNTRGALLGGMILGFAEAIMNTYFVSQWTDAIFFVVLIAVLLLRPQGLLGERSVAARF